MSSGHFFSQRFGYAAHALAYLSKKPTGALTTLPELYSWMAGVWPQTSEAYLSSVVQRLARGGILRSHRGIAGGYSLARSAKDITLRDVREVIDGVAVSRCALSLGPECPVRKTCNVQRTLCQLEEQHMKSLEGISIATIGAQMTIKLPDGARTAAE